MAQYASGREPAPVSRLTDAHAKLHVTNALLAINVIVMVAITLSGGVASLMNPGGDLLVRFGGLMGARSLFVEQWRLLTSTYVHAGILHIAFNMWCLWDLGGLAERIFDRWIFLFVYTFCGVAGSLTAAGWNPQSLTVGASGAIFGIAGALISALYLGNLPVSKSAMQSTLKSLLFFAGFNLLYGAAVSRNISNAAHIGGLVMGLALGAALSPSLTAPVAKRQTWSIVVFIGGGIVLGLIYFFLRAYFLRMVA